ncbi:MAG TPA: CBS domain-containing protein [Acidobacteriota bacterium]|nr:CBS domain-containing protein [Acidobacteriota bacterium]
MKISDIAQSPPPTCKATSMVDEAVRVMQNARGGAVVVIDNGRVRGIFTERDVLLRVVAASKDPESTLVREVMTSAVETVHQDSEALRGLERMVSRHIRHLPVVDENENLVGLVSMRNILLNHFDMLLEKASQK